MERISHLIQRLREARREKGLSQRTLSERIGLPQSHLSHIERGHVDLKTSNLVELARCLDLEVMLVPQKLITPVKFLLSCEHQGDHEIPPAYRLPKESDDD